MPSLLNFNKLINISIGNINDYTIPSSFINVNNVKIFISNDIQSINSQAFSSVDIGYFIYNGSSFIEGGDFLKNAHSVSEYYVTSIYLFDTIGGLPIEGHVIVLPQRTPEPSISQQTSISQRTPEPTWNGRWADPPNEIIRGEDIPEIRETHPPIRTKYQKTPVSKKASAINISLGTIVVIIVLMFSVFNLVRSCRVLNNLDEEEVDDIQSQNEFSFSSSGYSLYSASDE